MLSYILFLFWLISFYIIFYFLSNNQKYNFLLDLKDGKIVQEDIKVLFRVNQILVFIICFIIAVFRYSII